MKSKVLFVSVAAERPDWKDLFVTNGAVLTRDNPPEKLQSLWRPVTLDKVQFFIPAIWNIFHYGHYYPGGAVAQW